MERTDEEKEAEERTDDKIARLGQEIDRLKQSPALQSPVFTRSWLAVKRAIEVKDTERELLLEERRASKVVREYLEENPEAVPEEACPICLEPLWDRGGMLRFGCCGKAMCRVCTDEAAGGDVAAVMPTCPLCRREAIDRDKFVKELESKAAEGVAWAQYDMAVSYFYGDKVERDRDRAERMLRLAAEQEYSIAQFSVGKMFYERGEYSEALPFLEAAASKGDATALGFLGAMYLDGNGLEVDTAKGVRLLTVSTRLQSCNSWPLSKLGNCFIGCKGGLPLSPVRAKHYFKSAAKIGDNKAGMYCYANAILDVTSLYYDGKIFIPGQSSIPLALFWYHRAGGQTDRFPAWTIRFQKLEGRVRAQCANCQKVLSEEKPKCCGECKAAYYCGRDCQRQHWKDGHKKDCIMSLRDSLPA